ncbi:unnamed protein product [Aphis gossypii]|uniref:Secreted protein n=1 Tax=Aphis gossypii TaxID=80765 RepID=A0A9P0JA37_APHGO|nr:unnamed protein product [Aphis gossypii]
MYYSQCYHLALATAVAAAAAAAANTTTAATTTSVDRSGFREITAAWRIETELKNMYRPSGIVTTFMPTVRRIRFGIVTITGSADDNQSDTAVGSLFASGSTCDLSRFHVNNRGGEILHYRLPNTVVAPAACTVINNNNIYYIIYTHILLRTHTRARIETT